MSPQYIFRPTQSILLESPPTPATLPGLSPIDAAIADIAVKSLFKVNSS
jgi:hypothetical protein